MAELRLAPSSPVSLRARIGLLAASLAALSCLAIRPLLPQRPRAAIQRRHSPAAAPTSVRRSEAPRTPEPTPGPAPRPPEAPAAPSPDKGDVFDDVVRVPASDDYDIRCPYNAYATSYAAENLQRAVSRLRAVYPGQLVIGDISRKYGGSFGSHRSHQSGRDVDIWLPITGGLYRTDPECSMCGNAWCRANPDEVDWRITWTLIRTLEGTGAVERIFLARSLHPRLRAAALALGEPSDAVDRAIQPRPGAPALVMHSPGHTRHIHVRFSCDPSAPACEE